MSKRREREQFDLDEEYAVGPVRSRRNLRRGTLRSRTRSRRKVSTSRRNVVKPGGIHQRANKRVTW